MTDYAAKRAADHCPMHPGAVLADILPHVGKSKSEIARLLGISRQYLRDILEARKPLSPAMAVRIAKAFGGSAGSWLRMQASYDAWRAERDVDVSAIPTLRAA